jgi:hypothetical protein
MAGIAQSAERLPTGWTVRRSNPGGGDIFRTRTERPGAHPASYTMGTGSFSGVKRPGGASAEDEGRVELHICFPSGPSWPVLG